MKPGVQLIVNEIGKLTISQSKLFACENMWKGIEVKEGGKLIALSSIINDAQYAILGHRQSILTILECRFDRNDVALKNVLPTSPYYQKYPSFNLVEFSGNSVNCSGELLPGYSGQTPSPGSYSRAGMQFDNIQVETIGIGDGDVNVFKGRINDGIQINGGAVTIRNTEFYNIRQKTLNDPDHGHGINCRNAKLTVYGQNQLSSTAQEFECNRGSGIWAINSIVFVKDCNFKNNYNFDIRIPDNIGLTVTINQCKFTNCQNSSSKSQIYLYENGGIGKTFITDNYFSIAFGYDKSAIWKKGLNDENYRYFQKNNVFDITSYTTGTRFQATNVADMYIGDDAYTCHGACEFAISTISIGAKQAGKNIWHNTIESTETGVWECGIHTFESPSSWICDNILDRATKLMHLVGHNDKDNIQINTFKESVSGSFTSGNGLLLQKYANTAVCGEQYCSRNTWQLPLNSNYPDKAGRNQDNPNKSPFFVRNLSNENPDPSKLFPSSGWFFSVNCPGLSEEEAGCQDFTDPGSLTSYDTLLIAADLDSLDITEAVLSNQQKMLAQRIRSQSDAYSTNTLAQSFLSDLDSTLIPDFLDIEEQITRLAGLDSTSLANVETILGEQNDILQDLLVVDSLLLTYTPGTWPDSLLDQKADILAILDSLSDLNKTTIQVWDSLRSISLASTYFDVIAITPVSPYDSTIVAVYEILIRAKQNGTGFSQGMVDTLDLIAGKCYDTHGGGVLLARNWLPDSLSAPYNGEEMPNCSSSSFRSDHNKNLTPSHDSYLTIWPQPASNELFFAISNNLDIAQTQLYDLSGRLVLTQLSPSARIQLPQELSGLFVLKVILVDGQALTSKVILND